MLPSVLPTESDHVPVLADEVVAALDPRPGETVVDATFGAGGHASLLAKRLRGDGKLIAIDRDPTVAPYFERFRRATGVRARLLHGEFSADARAAGGERRAGRRRSCSTSASRRCSSTAPSAASRTRSTRRSTCAWIRARRYSARELVNETDERELADIFKRYGEERYAKQIARAIVRRRKQEPFERTGELVDVIKAAIPAPARFGEGHPAKRVFQALRIEVNDELGAVERALPAALQMLRPGGRLGVICFHSLEDRIVKRFLRRAEHGCTCPPDFPVCVCGSRADDARDAAPCDPAVRSRGRTQPARPVGAPARRDEGRLTMASASHAQAAVAEPLAPSADARSRTRGRKRRQARARGGILWIAMSGILLAGVVFVNVAVLRLNLALDGANADRVKLRAENAALQSELSSRLRSAQIQAQASKQLGLVYQDPSEYGYVDLAK